MWNLDLNLHIQICVGYKGRQERSIKKHWKQTNSRLTDGDTVKVGDSCVAWAMCEATGSGIRIHL